MLAKLKLDNLGLNLPHEEWLSNIRTNIKRHLPQVKPFLVQDVEVCLVGGGPSLEETLPELKELVENGCKIITVNGSHDWVVSKGLRPSAHVMIDGREWNSRFVKNPVKGCRYLIASQCHPSVFDALEGQDTWIFHAVNYKGETEMLDEYYMGHYHLIVGGSTVMLRAIHLVRMLGFKRMHIFGMDSCYLDDKHHAYDQPENDDYKVIPVVCAGKTFQCAAWQAAQAEDFMKFIRANGDNFELSVKGPGLIAHIIKTGAEMRKE